MMTLTTNRKVELMSNAKGDSKKYAQENKLFGTKEQRQSNRASAKEQKKDLKQQYKTGAISKEQFKSEKKSRRKAKRNAVKLQLKKRFFKDGSPLFIYRLKELFPDKATGKLKKKHADGTDTEVDAKDAIKTPQGYYDLMEIARVLNVSVETLRATKDELMSKLIPLTEASKNQETPVFAPRTDSEAGLGVGVPKENVTETEDGNYYTNNETYNDDDFNPKDKIPDVKDDENTPPLKNWEKSILWGGIAIAAIAVSIIVYRKIKSNGEKG